MNAWSLIVVLAVGTIALKAAGPVLAGGRTPPAAWVRVIALLTPALVTALVVADAFTLQRHVVLDARAAGLAVGAVLLWLRAPALVALVVAAAVTAVVRVAGG